MNKENHRAFIAGMEEEAKVLLRTQNVLYDGSWDDMEADLKGRLEGKPFIVKLVGRIEEDLERIQTLRKYEKQHQVNLFEYLATDD